MEVWQNAIDVRREELRGEGDDGEKDSDAFERQQAPLYSRGDDKMEEDDTREMSSTTPKSGSDRMMGKREREDVYAIKVLIPHRQAGCIIGKSGSTINAIQSESRARVQISKNREMYPGTQERVILISSPSSVDIVVDGLTLVLKKLYGGGDDENEEDKIDVDESTVLRLLVPNAAAGSVIGKAGVNIKDISSKSGANLKFANKNDMITGIYERVVTVVGNERQQLDCTKMILNTMYSDDERTSKSQYYNPTVNYSRRMDSRHGGGYHHRNMGGHYRDDFYGGHRDYSPHYNRGGGYHRGPPMDHRRSPPSAARFNSPPPDIPRGFDGPSGGDSGSGDQHTMTVQVPDQNVGSIIGQGGRAISEICKISGAVVRISRRGEFWEGTRNRIVTITGTPQSCQTAHALIQHQMNSSYHRPQQNGGGGGIAPFGM